MGINVNVTVAEAVSIVSTALVGEMKNDAKKIRPETLSLIVR